jgi:hypothetical protein
MWALENSPRRSSGPIFVDYGIFLSIYVDDGIFLSSYVDDGIFQHPHVVLLRHAWLLYNSEYRGTITSRRCAYRTTEALAMHLSRGFLGSVFRYLTKICLCHSSLCSVKSKSKGERTDLLIHLETWGPGNVQKHFHIYFKEKVLRDVRVDLSL